MNVADQGGQVLALFDEDRLREKLISEKKARQLLNWKHSGFSLDAGDTPVYNAAGRQQLAEYLLRAPFSLEKITWVEKTKRVIYDIETMEPLCVPALFRWAQQDDSESIDASQYPVARSRTPPR